MIFTMMSRMVCAYGLSQRTMSGFACISRWKQFLRQWRFRPASFAVGDAETLPGGGFAGAGEPAQRVHPGAGNCVKVTVDNSRHQARIFRDIQQRYPHLVYYDADLSSNIRHAARYGTFPMAFCEVEHADDGLIHSLQVLNSRWDLAPVHPVFRVLNLEPDCDPGRGEPTALRLQYGRKKQTLMLHPAADLIVKLNWSCSRRTLISF